MSQQIVDRAEVRPNRHWSADGEPAQPEGAILFKERFYFKERLGEGSFGAIRDVKDIKKPYKKLVVKIQEHQEIYENEKRMLSVITRQFE